MAKKLRIGVVFGGRSAEHEVSLRSAEAVVSNLDPARYDVVPIGISPEGRWVTAPRFDQLVEGGRLRVEHGTAVSRLPEPAAPSLVRLDGGGAPGEDAGGGIDVLFPVIHGTYGEDGTLQGLLELADVPYVGCGVLASAAGMDKDVMKRLFLQAGLPMARFQTVLRSTWEAQPEATLDHLIETLGLPMFVKPANLGSSVGISRAADRDALAKALDHAAEFDRKLVIEEAVDAREIEVSVLGNDVVEVSVPGEIVPDAEFYSYDSKYVSTGSLTLIPAPIDAATTAEIRRQAEIAYRAIDGAGLSRVDFFLRRGDGAVLINEVNTMPGFTSISMYAKMWAASGVSYPELLDRLIRLAQERHADRRRNRTRA